MKDLFIKGGPTFMGILTILLIITTAWIIYHFVVGYNSKQANQEKFIRRIEYGKSMGLFALVTGICGQMIGLSGMFHSIEEVVKNGIEINTALVFGGIKVTMICTIYGILIYLLSLVLWFVSSLILEKKLHIK
ncbi:MAG: hypothetical protein COB60_01175 [Flavobacteriaceae bacterium]|nr:MAG: hypothetical protein COB60_01175 [Flavobacteriaceae bacterium]